MIPRHPSVTSAARSIRLPAVDVWNVLFRGHAGSDRFALLHHAHDAYEDFDGDGGTSADAVQILTVHQAKGLEWPVVFLPALVQRRFPSSLTGRGQSWLLHGGRARLRAATAPGLPVGSRALRRVRTPVPARGRARLPAGARDRAGLREGDPPRPAAARRGGPGDGRGPGPGAPRGLVDAESYLPFAQAQGPLSVQMSSLPGSSEVVRMPQLVAASEPGLFSLGVPPDEIALVYQHDHEAKRPDAKERLRLHQEKSAPVMARLRIWMESQLGEKKVEPNSGRGRAIRYSLECWEKLTLFLRVPGAPLDNSLAERMLKRAIRHRRNSLFYKTENGAAVGDLYMSLIATAKLADVDPFDYLTGIQRHAEEVADHPADWMPWNYRATLASLTASSRNRAILTLATRWLPTSLPIRPSCRSR